MLSPRVVSKPPMSLIFDVADNWDAPRFPWHEHYPPEAPPGSIVPEMRAEKFLACAARQFPNRVAMHFFASHWTYGQLEKRVAQVAGHFEKLGIVPGDRVILVLPNCPEFVVAWFALLTLGAEIIPANPLYPGSEIASLIERTKPKMVIGLDVRLEPCAEAIQKATVPILVVVSIAPHLRAHLRALYALKLWTTKGIKISDATRIIRFGSLYRGTVRPVTESRSNDLDAVAVLQPTGGTTGSPKLAMITHRNLVSQISQNNVMARRTPAGDVCIATLPFFHVYGATVIMLASVSGAATMVLFPRFDVKQLAAEMEKYQITALPLVPFMFQALNEELTRRPRKFNRIEIVTSGASSLDPTVRDRFRELTGAEINEGYGLSEASPVLTANLPGINRVGTVGLPIPDTEVRIVDVENPDVTLPAGEVGELIARGPQIMKGYLDNSEETNNTIRDGWLFTGDLATMDGDGYVRIVDRKKDMIISGGLNVYPTEVESKILSIPGVAQCAVVGEKDARWGEKVVAYIVRDKAGQLEPESMRHACRPLMAPYKIPREFYFVEELPVSFLGKLKRVDLRKAQPPGDRPDSAAAC